MKKMAKRKSSAFIEAAASIVILLAILWVFDRPLAITILGRMGWTVVIAASIVAFFVALFFVIKRARGQKVFAVQNASVERHPEPSGAGNMIRKILDRDATVDREGVNFNGAMELSEKPRSWSLGLSRVFRTNKLSH